MKRLFKKFKNKNGLANLDELYIPEVSINWPNPWCFLKGQQESILYLQKELNSEIGRKHPLWGLKPVVFAKSEANDDVIVHLKDGRFAKVHLIWHGSIDQQPDLYPSSTIFNNRDELEMFMKSESVNYT